MTKAVSSAEARTRFSSLLGEVAFAGHRVIIERRGRALAAIVSIADLEYLESQQPVSSGGRGALALAGAWREVPENELDAVVEEIYAARDLDSGRAVVLEP
jgi:prevent-host-death family protein